MSKLVVCHVDSGGAYRVAKFYAETISANFLVCPSFMELVSAVASKPSNIIFHAPHQCARSIIFIKLLSPNSKVWCVEHFVLSQILRSELNSSIQRNFWLLQIYINRIFGVKTISIDKFSESIRKRLLKKSVDATIGNVIPQYQPTAELSKYYDWVWAGSFSSQKRWEDAKRILIDLKIKNKNLRLLVCSYQKISNSDFLLLKESGIDFRFNDSEWYKRAHKFLFTSDYEGFPLALAEAMSAGMGILAWSRRSCYSQLLKFYTGARWVSNSSNLSDEDFLLTPTRGLLKSGALFDHHIDYVKDKLIKVFDEK